MNRSPSISESFAGWITILSNEFFNRSGSQRDRDRASKAIQRIAKELKRRNVRP
jgi:hypothetical protein